MMTYEMIKSFWGSDLKPLKISEKLVVGLSEKTKLFLSKYGLPRSGRIYNELEVQVQSYKPFPDWTYSEEIIRAKSPFFEFDTSKLMIIEFHGQKFIRVGTEFNNDIAIDLNNDDIYYLIRSPIDPWPADIPLVQKSFLNSEVEKLVMFLTAVFISGRELIDPSKQYVEAFNSKNHDLVREALDETKRIIDNLEKEFREIDSKALNMQNSWWAAYLQNTRTYLGVK